MSDNRTPEELAEQLDRLMRLNRAQPSKAMPSDPLLNAAARMAAAPRPALSSTARARIKAQMMAAAAPTARRRPVMRPMFGYFAAALAGAAVVIFAVIGVIAFSMKDNPTATPQAVANVTLTNTTVETPDAASTATDEATVEPTNEITSVPGATDTIAPSPIERPTLVDTASAGATGAPDATQPSTLAPDLDPIAEVRMTAALIVEGPIEDIDGKSITVSGLKIKIKEESPLLRVLRIGDEVRLEGEVSLPLIDAVELTVALTELTLTNDDPEQNTVEIGSDGEVWRDAGDCANPPPPWAAAKGWRARCEGGTAPGNQGNPPGNQGNPPENPGQNNPNRPENPGRPDDPRNSGNNQGNPPGNQGNPPENPGGGGSGGGGGKK